MVHRPTVDLIWKKKISRYVFEKKLCWNIVIFIVIKNINRFLFKKRRKDNYGSAPKFCKSKSQGSPSQPNIMVSVSFFSRSCTNIRYGAHMLPLILTLDLKTWPQLTLRCFLFHLLLFQWTDTTKKYKKHKNNTFEWNYTAQKIMNESSMSLPT